MDMDTEQTFFLTLKDHRESKSITLDEISEFTKINPKYLNAIEEGDFNVIPNVYMRLFIRSYTKYIGADYNQALADYELHTTGKIQPKFSDENKTNVLPSEKSVSSESIGSYDEGFQVDYKQVLKITGVITAIFIAFLLLKSISSDDNDSTSPSIDGQTTN